MDSSDDYSDSIISFSWTDLQNEDNFYKVFIIIGNGKIQYKILEEITMNKNNRNKNAKDTATFDSKDVVNQMVDAIADKEKG